MEHQRLFSARAKAGAFVLALLMTPVVSTAFFVPDGEEDTEGIPLPGACCLIDGTCIQVIFDDCLALGGDFQGDGTSCIPGVAIEPGRYLLRNHPDGNQAPPAYGMRLDELIDVTPGHDIFSYDFEAPGAEMYLEFDGTTVHIFGTAYGGLDIGDTYDPNYVGFIFLDFTYGATEPSAGDDDLISPIGAPNGGTLTFGTSGDTVELFDFANDVDPFTFRLGNEDDDTGHRGYPGTSGWGWLAFGTPDNHFVGNDWLFIGLPVCSIGACCFDDGTCLDDLVNVECVNMLGNFQGEGTICADVECVAIGACCLDDGTCIDITDEICLAMSGDYQGDGTLCADTNCPQPGACCLTAIDCVNDLEVECVGIGGIFQGEGTVCVADECSDVDFLEGCTRGYWINHPGEWEACTPTGLFAEVFDDAFPGYIMMEVFKQTGTHLNTLGHETLAAYLNAQKNEINFGMTAEEIVDKFNACYPGTDADYQALTEILRALNEEGCPL